MYGGSYYKLRLHLSQRRTAPDSTGQYRVAPEQAPNSTGQPRTAPNRTEPYRTALDSIFLVYLNYTYYINILEDAYGCWSLTVHSCVNTYTLL